MRRMHPKSVPSFRSLLEPSVRGALSQVQTIEYEPAKERNERHRGRMPLWRAPLADSPRRSATSSRQSGTRPHPRRRRSRRMRHAAGTRFSVEVGIQGTVCGARFDGWFHRNGTYGDTLRDYVSTLGRMGCIAVTGCNRQPRELGHLESSEALHSGPAVVRRVSLVTRPN